MKTLTEQLQEAKAEITELKAENTELKTSIEELNKIDRFVFELPNFVDTVDRNYITRNGRIIEVQYRAKIKENIPDNKTLLKLPFNTNTSGAPTFSYGIGYRYQITEMAWGYIDGNKLILEKYPAGKYIHIAFMYIDHH